MLIDSSVWINYLLGKKNKETDLLDKSFAIGLAHHICPPVFQEVLQGINKDSEFETTKNILIEMNFLNLDSYFAGEEAAKIYRLVRKKGITIRKPNDCLIAFYAMHFKLELVHNDKDFEKIAKYTTLKTYTK
jgi:predicted nucleic acid-binding protein